MKSARTFKWLLLANLVLLAWLAWGFHTRKSVINSAARVEGPGPASAPSKSKTEPVPTLPAPTPFAQVYSADPRVFADNLRAIHCPEQTIRDIITAEVHRRFKGQEEALRPTPADHVPFSWSARTTEPRLLERRVQAGIMAREEGALLREALGCQATVPMPIYAMTSSDQQFEQELANAPGTDTCSARQVQDTYWEDVQALLQRTKDFWLPQDLAELEALKAKRREALGAYLPGQ